MFFTNKLFTAATLLSVAARVLNKENAARVEFVFGINPEIRRIIIPS